MKKFLKAGIAGAMACTLLGSAAMPASAKEVPVNTDQEVTKIAEEVTPRFMYTQTRTVTSPEFDTVATIDTVETSSTSSGWKIVGVQDVDLISKRLSVIAWGYTYSYYDNYQGVNLNLTYYYAFSGSIQTGTKTVKVHI
ncbi:MAG TPA: hypothetical protein H9702_04260 [Candidatus Merdibacter merdavium]|uniref:Uncharacterized protein n=1 Tax=Candidatus Merdibacter merdavium TaxID=2838692 RepID=A0A9D2NPU3_9FIRM|nr:hypothetical protein [Candidatus Merdibacter merdavium]